MPTKRLTDGNDTYTTDGKFDVILALKGNDKITIQKVFYDVENDVTRITRAVQFCDFGRPWARRRSRLRALV